MKKIGIVPIRIRIKFDDVIGLILWSVDTCTSVGPMILPIFDKSSMIPIKDVCNFSGKESTFILAKNE